MTDEGYTNNESNLELPIVTIFGAGVAGLSAAHELIERGFRVQVVEPKPSPTREYECAVGGLAANQFTRVRASLQALHPWLMAPENVLNLAHALKFRDWGASIEQTAKRFPLNQKLRFDKRAHKPPSMDLAPADETPGRTRLEPADPIPDAWRQYWDCHGVRNATKLQAVFDTIRNASQVYTKLYFPKLAEELAQGRDPDLKDRRDLCAINDSDDNAREFIARETFFVRIVGYTDADHTEETNRVFARHWASQVRDALIARNEQLKAAQGEAASGPRDPPIWELNRRLEVVVRGSSGARRDGADARRRSLANRVEFEIVEQVIPGEHGFRFFPGFYRHLFDTMKRTPLFDESGAVSGTAYDQLVVTPHPQLAMSDGLHDFDFRKIGSLKQLHAAKNLMIDKIGFRPKDLIGLQFRTLRYMTSGGKRREREAEPISLISYLGGEAPERRFSSQCLEFIDRAPRALAAMSARESDARTQFDITLQLMLKGLPDPMTLNGPPSLVWLDDWKAYLKRQGVSFFVGHIDAIREFKPSDGSPPRFAPVVRGPTIGRAPEPELHPLPEDPEDIYWAPSDVGDNGHLSQHRFVLATQFQTASDLVWGAYEWARANNQPFDGPFRQLVAFDELSGRRKAGDAAARQPERDLATGKEPATWPIRTISGLQFFFPQAYRFGQSNIYFGFSPYALTSISQYAYWRQHSQAVGQLLGQISIDIGDWHSPYPPADPASPTGPGHPAFYASAQEIASATWEQVKAGFGKTYAEAIQHPRYYHLDQNMVFFESEPDAQKRGWRHAGAVRANAIVRVPSQTNANAAFTLATDREYVLECQVGVGGKAVVVRQLLSAEPTGGADAIALRDRLVQALESEPSVLAAAGDAADLVLSPVVRLASVTLRVLGKSAAPFQIKLADRLIGVQAAGRDIAGATDAIAGALAEKASDLVRVTRIAPNSLTLAPAVGDSIAVATLNVSGQIELVGAPPLILRTFNLMLVEPEKGFVLMRNDYEYLINIPDQWRTRPGLRRGDDAKAVPARYWEFARNFGVANPEICYSHSTPALEYWVGAGTYMATYTRMTTMEAAAESGRHAAAAIIFDLSEAARLNKQKHYTALAGDFPAVFPVEDNEGDDLSFFTALDDALFDSGLPHLFDILGLTSSLESLLDGHDALSTLQAQIATRLKLSPLANALPPNLAAGLRDLFAKFLGEALSKAD